MMKDVTVRNYSHTEGSQMGQDGNSFTVKPITAGGENSQCQVNFVEVEPGNYAYGYHYHEMNEEVFYIISGTGIIKTVDKDLTVHAGDAITFPTGPKGAHVIRNGSDTKKLIYIDFDTQNTPEIVHFPEIDKVMLIGPYSSGMYEKQSE